MCKYINFMPYALSRSPHNSADHERLYFILFRGVMLFRSGPAHQNDFPIYTAKAASKKMIPPLGSGIW
jgi:hypothetical protein